MRYKEDEVREIGFDEWHYKPSAMLVWNDGDCEPRIRLVYGVADFGRGRAWVANSVGEGTLPYAVYGHCAAIPWDEPRDTVYEPASDAAVGSRRATNRELSEWLSQGRGQALVGDMWTTSYSYVMGDDERPVPRSVSIRRNGDGEILDAEPSVMWPGEEGWHGGSGSTYSVILVRVEHNVPHGAEVIVRGKDIDCVSNEIGKLMQSSGFFYEKQLCKLADTCKYQIRHGGKSISYATNDKEGNQVWWYAFVNED